MTSDYGKYRLAFEPPADQITPGVEMTLSGEADVNQMLAMFESFLQAAGYVLKGELQIAEADREYRDSWRITSRGSQGIDFVPYSLSDDVISFGSK